MSWLRKIIGFLTGWYLIEGLNTWSRRKMKITLGGETCIVTSPVLPSGKLPYSASEIEGMSIRCAWCGDYIRIGEPITLYIPREGVTVPEYAVPYGSDPVAYVGCLSMDCCDTGADRSGFWLPDPEHRGKGHVHRVMSPMEELMARMNRGEEEPVIIVGDVGSPKEANERLRRLKAGQE